MGQKTFEPPTPQRMQTVLDEASAARGKIDAAKGARDQKVAAEFNRIASEAHSFPAEMRDDLVRRMRDEARNLAGREFHDGQLPQVQRLLDSGEELRVAERHYENDVANLDRHTILHAGRATATANLSSAGPAQLRSALEAAEALRATNPEDARAVAMACILRLQALGLPAEQRPFSTQEVAARFAPPSVLKARETIRLAKMSVASGVATWRGTAASSLEKISRGLSGAERPPTTPAGAPKPPTPTERVAAGLAAREGGGK